MLDQYRTVHQAIQAIASHCDGARERDMVGFDGTDTKYGKRIASVPFETLTADDWAEESRIVGKYRKQVHTYLGVDVFDLDVVRDAQGQGTNYNSRQNARDYERKARAAHKKDERKATLLPDGRVALTWVKGDPDFKELLTEVKKLPGRGFNWDTKANEVPASEDLLAFLDAWDIQTPEEVVQAVRTVLEAPRPVVEHITLLNAKTISIAAPYDAARVEDARALPGRWFNRAEKRDEVTPSGKVLDFAAKWKLTVSAEAREACVEAAKAEERSTVDKAAQGDLKALLAVASRAKTMEELPKAFLVAASRAVQV